MPVNTAGTYRLKDAALTIDTGGTPVTLEVAASSIGLEVEHNYAQHERTGGGAPFEEYIDSVWTLTLSYALGFGTDGIHTVFEGLAGTEVDWLLETSSGVVSATFPTFAFTADVPPLGIDATEWGEFSTGEVEIKIKGEPVKATI